MSLKDLIVNPKPEPPEVVKHVASSYLKNGEEYNIFPQRAVVNEEVYYFVTYFDKKNDENLLGILLIHESGRLPLHKDCLEIYERISAVETGLTNVLFQGASWSKRPMGIWKRLQSLVQSFAEIVSQSDDEELKKGYEVFCSIPRVMFETQEELKEVVELAKKYYREITIDYLITEEFYKKVDDNYLRMMENMKKQFEVQIETRAERTAFMKKLKKEIPLFSLPKWYCYLRLLKLHRWLNADGRTMVEYKEFKSDISREKASEPKRKKQIESIRNPRD